MRRGTPRCRIAATLCLPLLLLLLPCVARTCGRRGREGWWSCDAQPGMVVRFSRSTRSPMNVGKCRIKVSGIEIISQPRGLSLRHVRASPRMRTHLVSRSSPPRHLSPTAPGRAAAAPMTSSSSPNSMPTGTAPTGPCRFLHLSLRLRFNLSCRHNRGPTAGAGPPACAAVMRHDLGPRRAPITVVPRRQSFVARCVHSRRSCSLDVAPPSGPRPLLGRGPNGEGGIPHTRSVVRLYV